MTIKITERDQQVLDLLREGCSNKEIGKRMGICHNTVKAHIARLCDRAGVDPRSTTKRLHLLNRLYPAQVNEKKLEALTEKQRRVVRAVLEGRKNREIADAMVHSEQVIKNDLRNIFDRVGVWSRLELRNMLTL